MHATAREKSAANEAAWRAEWDQERAEGRRQAEAHERATEILAEIRPLLEAAGLRPDTFDVTRSGDIAGPAESVRELVRLAAELASLPDDLLAEILPPTTGEPQ
jgi:hypothetical protein